MCFCEHIPQIALRTRVLVLMHSNELTQTTNTAKIALRALTNSELRIHGRLDRRLTSGELHEPDRTPLLLYPSPFAKVLNPQFVAGLTNPVTLIVPDANWRQTHKFSRREPALAGIMHVCLPPGPPSEFQLRVQRNEAGVCTLEAIARALGELESRDAQAALERVLRIMVERTLWSRGRISTEECVNAGIPAGAAKHVQNKISLRSSRRRAPDC